MPDQRRQPSGRNLGAPDELTPEQDGQQGHLRHPSDSPFWKSYRSTTLGLPFFLLPPRVLCPRVWNRTVDHDDDGEGEHDRCSYPPGQDQQGHYLG